MPEISDEILMSFADGMLSPQEHVEVAAAVRNDPELARRLRAFEATGIALQRLYDPIFNEPVPARLIERIRSYQAPVVPARPTPSRIGGLWSLLSTMSVAPARPLLFGGACAAALIVGWAGFEGYNPSSGDGPAIVVAGKDGHAVATGDFKAMFETLPSRVRAEFKAADGAAIVLLSFKSKDAAYCRQYELQMAEGRPLSGVACRTSAGEWRIDREAEISRAANLEMAASPGKLVVAGDGDDSASAVEQRVDELIAGDALGGDEERAAMRRAWANE